MKLFQRQDYCNTFVTATKYSNSQSKNEHDTFDNSACGFEIPDVLKMYLNVKLNFGAVSHVVQKDVSWY